MAWQVLHQALAQLHPELAREPVRLHARLVLLETLLRLQPR
jgi:hypothetical protein